MERKSIGSFITVLRKASGLTQKDLAEKLNVSDKTISRWERDENAPDLSVIPVLAEIFNVTCDELLCGERKAQAETAAHEPPRKAKQLKRILEDGLHKFENHTYVAMAISTLGLVGGLLANFGFLQARIGFFISLIFFVVAGVYQCIASSNASYGMRSDAFDDVQLQPYKARQFDGNKRSFLVSVTYFLVMLWVFFAVDGTHVGLSVESFLLLTALILVVWGIFYKVLIEGFLTKIALKNGFYIETPAIAKQQRLQRLKYKAVVCSAVLCAVTLLVQIGYMGCYSARSFAQYTSFTEIDDFVAYMAIETERAFYSEYDTAEDAPVQIAPESAVGATTYYDENGNEITEEKARTSTIEDANGNVICTYQHNNRAVTGMRFNWNGDALQEIRTYTQDDLREGQWRYNAYGNLLNWGYPLALCVGAAYYFVRRKRWQM